MLSGKMDRNPAHLIDWIAQEKKHSNAAKATRTLNTKFSHII
jgi:hypothetical protein